MRDLRIELRGPFPISDRAWPPCARRMEARITHSDHCVHWAYANVGDWELMSACPEAAERAMDAIVDELRHAVAECWARS